MISFNSMYNNPNNYSIIKSNNNDKTITVLFDAPKARDEEMVYRFNPDGSATSQSLAWGNTKTLPPGALSYLLVKSPLTKNDAYMLVKGFDQYATQHNIKSVPARYR